MLHNNSIPTINNTDIIYRPNNIFVKNNYRNEKLYKLYDTIKKITGTEAKKNVNVKMSRRKPHSKLTDKW